MNTLPERWRQARQALAAAEQRFGREAGSVTLLAVSKTRGPEEILTLAREGQRDFGENYLQEAREKMERLREHPLVWHFIGPVQSNKTREIARRCHWTHSVDRLKIARRLHEARPDDLPPLNVCIQVNIDAEPGKGGTTPAEAGDLAMQILPLSRLKLRGLMALPAPADDFDTQRRSFAQVRALYEELVRGGVPLDTLSMGTTGAMEAAIAEGATMVRLGAALFGPRTRGARRPGAA